MNTILTTDLFFAALAALRDAPETELGPVYLAPALYDAGKEAGCDMTGYAKTFPIPQHLHKSAGILSRTEVPACMPAHGGKCSICGTGDCTRRP